VTRIVAGLESLTGGRGRYEPEKRWFAWEWTTNIKSDRICYISPILRDNFEVHAIRWEFINSHQTEKGGVHCRACVTQNQNLNYLDMPQERQIIEWKSEIIDLTYKPHKNEKEVQWDCLRRFQGSNLRLALGFQCMTDDSIYVWGGILFSEP